MDYVLTIDIGTTSTKVALFSRDGSLERNLGKVRDCTVVAPLFSPCTMPLCTIVFVALPQGIRERKTGKQEVGLTEKQNVL